VKILHILDHSLPLHSGYTFRTRGILDAQRARGWQTAHLTSTKHKGPPVAEEDSEGLHFYRTPAVSGWVGRLPVVNQWEVVRALERRLREVIARERPDVLHAHSPSLNGVAAVRAGRRAGLPLVYECRAFWEDAAADHGTSSAWGPRYRLSRELETRVFRQAGAVTCICEGLRTDIIARGIPESKVTVIPNAVDAERFAYGMPRDEALAAELGLTRAMVLGFLGSFYTYEGLELAIRALPLIRQRCPEARLLLVGGGPEEEALQRLSVELGLRGQVLMIGRVPHDHVQRYYGLVDVLLYPRLPMRLTDLVTPLKPLEAMAQGKLLVASDVGGHRELIRDGETGRLFRGGSVEALAEAVVALLAARELWEPLRQAGRAYVEHERTWPASIARYADVYGALTPSAAA
jgi:PEP-CTERM/exosortase A-associated glycosyltransferase